MTVDAIEHFLQARPYQVFRLITASGESYEVPHPDFLHFSPSHRTCNVYARNGEFFSTLDLEMITDLQPNGVRGPRKRRK